MKMNTSKFQKVSPFAFGAICTSLLVLATSASAQTYEPKVSWSVDAPVVDGADVASFVGSPDQAGNIMAGDDVATFIAADRGAQGQTFITTGAAGQMLHAFTYQHVVGGDTWWSLDEGWSPYSGGRFAVYVGTIANGIFSPLRAAQAYMSDVMPNAGSQSGIGTGLYGTITFSNPLALEPNTEYAVAWTVISDPSIKDGPYWEINGTSGNPYSDGTAFSLGGNWKEQNQNFLVTVREGDRVFHVDISGELPQWAGLPIDENGWVDTGDWMGALYVVEDPWIYSAKAGAWLYLPGESISESGAWTYVPAQ